MAICTTLATLATVAGAGLQVAGALKAREASDRVTRAELARQSEYRKQATSTFADSLSKSTPQKAQQTIGEGATKREGDYASARSVPLTEGAAPFTGGESSRLVSASGAASQDKLSDAVRARLAGYTDWDLQQAIKNLRAQQDLAQISNFSQGSQGVLPTELNAAAHAGDSLSGIGSILGLAGGLGSAWSAAAAPAVAGAATPNVLPAFGTGLDLWGSSVANAPRSNQYYNFVTGRKNP